MKRLRKKLPFLIISLLMPFVPLQAQVVWTQIGDSIGGSSTSLSADGSIVAIGNRGYNMGTGQVRIFENQNGFWSQIGSGIDGEATGDHFGWSVSLSADGSVVAIGAPWNDRISLLEVGHVRIFENQGGTWSQIGTINGEAAGDHFGFSTSLSADGSIVAIGAPRNDGNGLFAGGNVRIFENQDGGWNQIGDAIDGEATDDRFGRSVSLSADGSIVAIGAPYNDNHAGHVRIFKNQGGLWSQIGETIEGEGEGGASTCLSADGSVVAIGEPVGNPVNGGYYSTGHVRVFEYHGGIWSQIGSAIEGKAKEDYFGASVSLSADGSVIAIGAPYNDDNGYEVGHVRVFENQSSVWSQIGNAIKGKNSYEEIGWSTSLSADGSVVAIGGSVPNNVRIYKRSAVSNDPIPRQEISLYPNPTTGSFQVKGITSDPDGIKVEMYDMSGKMVFARKYRKDSPAINIENLTPGVYFVKLIVQDQTAFRKVIKR